jgi:hypothetical protein
MRDAARLVECVKSYLVIKRHNYSISKQVAIQRFKLDLWRKWGTR